MKEKRLEKDYVGKEVVEKESVMGLLMSGIPVAIIRPVVQKEKAIDVDSFILNDVSVERLRVILNEESKESDVFVAYFSCVNIPEDFPS